MSIADQIKKALQDEYYGGGKQQEMAAAHHVSQQYISRLLSGKRSCNGLSVEVVSRMFPRATLNINGDTVVAENSGINNGVMGINHGTVNATTDREIKDSCLNSVIDKIIADPELSDTEKIKFIKVLKK